MHKTKAGGKKKTLHRKALELARDAKSLQMAAAHLPAARKKAQRLQAEAESALAEAAALKLQARLEDLHLPARNGLREIATREFKARGQGWMRSSNRWALRFFCGKSSETRSEFEDRLLPK